MSRYDKLSSNNNNNDDKKDKDDGEGVGAILIQNTSMDDEGEDEMSGHKYNDGDTNSTIDDDEHMLLQHDIKVSSKLYYVPPNRSTNTTPRYISSPFSKSSDAPMSTSPGTHLMGSSPLPSHPSPLIYSQFKKDINKDGADTTTTGTTSNSNDNIQPTTPISSYSNNNSPVLLSSPSTPTINNTTPLTTSLTPTKNSLGLPIQLPPFDLSSVRDSSGGEEGHIILDQHHTVTFKDTLQDSTGEGISDPPVQDFNRGEDDADNDDILKRILEIRNFKFQKKHKKKALHYLYTLLPIISWIRSYDWKSGLRGDLVAGLTVGVMLIPQGMAYAMVAQLPPIYGLYSSIVPVLAYALFGTSRQLSVGPFAIISLLVLETVNGEVGAASTDMGHRVSVSILLAFVCGILQIVLGLLRFGFVANFLSDPVKTGFISGCALIIMSSQIKHILGYSVEGSNFLLLLLIRYLEKLGHTNWWSVLIGVAGIVLLVVIKKVNARFKIKIPGPLVVVFLFTLLSFLIDFEKHGNVQLVGKVPSGIPSPRFPVIYYDNSTMPVDTNWPAVVWRITPGALVLVLVGFISSVSVSTKFAEQNNYAIDANQELVALGAADFLGSFFLAFPVGASLSRTAVNAQSGAVSQIAGIVTAIIIVVSILLLTPVVYFLPKAILASIVMVAVIDLIEYKIAAQLWRVHRKDLMLYCVSLGSTITLGILQGILIGIIASLLLIIYRSAYPPFAVLGRLPGTDVYKNIKRVPKAETFKGIQIVRIDGSIYFANTQFIKQKLRGYEPFRKREDYEDSAGEEEYDDSSIVEMATINIDGNPTKGAIIIDCSSMNDIDSTGIRMLKELVVEFRERQMVLYFASVKGYIRDLLKKGGVVEHYGADHFFWTINDAVNHHLFLIRDSRAKRKQLSKLNQTTTIKKNFDDSSLTSPTSDDGIQMTSFSSK